MKEVDGGGVVGVVVLADVLNSDVRIGVLGDDVISLVFAAPLFVLPEKLNPANGLGVRPPGASVFGVPVVVVMVGCCGCCGVKFVILGGGATTAAG